MSLKESDQKEATSSMIPIGLINLPPSGYPVFSKRVLRGKFIVILIY